MKKVLSLVLVFLMVLAIASPALASNIDDPYDLVMTEKSVDNLGDDYQMLPGYTYYIELTNGDFSIDIDKRDFRIDFDIDSGSKYVESYGLEDGEFYITVVNDHSLTVDDPGYISFEISLTAKDDWDKRGIKKGDDFYYSDSFDVGNDIYYVDTDDDPEFAEMYDASGSSISFSADGDRGWVIFDCGHIDILMRMSSSRVIAFDPDDSKISAVDKLFKNSVPKFVTFLAEPTIPGTATFMVDDDYDYVYSYDGSKLTQIKVEEDGRYNVWEMTDAKLGTFVLSTEPASGAAAQQPASSQTETPASSSAAPAPAPESSAALAPAPESSAAEPVEEPVEEPAEEPAVDITPEPEEEPAPEISEEEEVVEEPEEEEESSKSFLPVTLMILAAAIVVAILVALLISRTGKKSRR